MSVVTWEERDPCMIHKLNELARFIGNTPLVPLQHEKVNLHAKLEFHNLMGSVKVRPAFYIIKKALENGVIDQDSTIIESSSGNFGIALATICRRIGLKFIPVIDPNINPSYENLLNALSYRVSKVEERDPTGGYLLTRIQRVQELLDTIPNAHWTNQYGNIENFNAHYHGLGTELAHSFEQLDYAFIGVSSGGTISGVSRRLKEQFPHIKIIAVDTCGSVIFGDKPKKRYIPGIGSGMVPDVLQNASIDEVIHVEEIDTVDACYRLFEEHGIFAGGSSGTSYHAVNQYFADKTFSTRPNVVFLCPDGGIPYVDTVYDPKWVKWLREQSQAAASV